jgi:putative intracellular protease/amidase
MMNRRQTGLALGGLLLAACRSSAASNLVPNAASTVTQKVSKMNIAKKVLIVLTSHSEKGSTGQKTGAYAPELTHPYDVFHAAGFTVEFASVKGGAVPLDGVDRKDPSIAAFMDNAELVNQLHASKSPRAVVDSVYDAIFYAGGHGTMWDFADEPLLAQLAARSYERGGVVGAVCHGPAALVNVKLTDGQYLVAGKDVAAFTDEEERAVGLEKVVPFLLSSKLAERGAKMHPAPNWQKQVVVSERLVTGQNPASAKGVAEEMTKLLQAR